MGKIKKNIFYIVDVFAEKKYCGNQLAVILDGKNLSPARMQDIAREINFSETTFIVGKKKEKENSFRVRIFTPKEEIPFAGHPTLGTAYVLQQEVIRNKVSEIFLDLKAGEIPVNLSYKKDLPDLLWMRPRVPQFGRIISPARILKVLKLEKKDLADRFPIQEVSTGLPFIIVPLKNIEAVRRAQIDREEYFSLIEKTLAKAVFIFCPQTENKKNDLHVRAFGDYYGVPEDPATGSANSCLAGYLVKHRYFGRGQIDVRVEQGYEMGRPSLLYLKAAEENGVINISVGGKVIPVARGEIG